MALPGSLHRTPSRLAVRFLQIAVLALAMLFFSGCVAAGSMGDQPRYDPLEDSQLFPDGQSARPLVEGSVPFTGEGSPNNPEQTGLDENGEPIEGLPVEVNPELVALGQERYNIFCTPCHGAVGEGNGRAVSFGVPKPPSLLDENARNLTSGQLFDIITNGQGQMFPYGYRVKSDERWAIISYIRALQLKEGAVNLEELTEAEIQQIGDQP